MLNHPVLNLLFAPGMKLMRHMGFPAKMLLMALVLALPLAWLTTSLLHSVRQDLVATRGELLGRAVVGPAIDVTLLVQRHRSLLQRRLGGDSGTEAELASTRARLKAELSAVDSAVQAMPELASLWSPLQSALARLAAGDHPQEAAQSFALHTQHVASLRSFVLRAAEASTLLLDPEAAPYQLMHLTVNQVLPWTEALSRMHVLGIAAAAEPDTTRLASALAQRAMLDDRIAMAGQTVAALGRAGEPAPAGFSAAVDASETFARRLDDAVASARAGTAAAAGPDDGSDAIASVAAMADAAQARLTALLSVREQRLAWQWTGGLVAAAVALFGMAYLVTVFFRTSFGAIRVLRGSVSLLAAGDFSTRVQLRGNDELAVVGQTLDAMTGRLSEMVSDIRSNSAMVAQAGMKLATDTKALSERTEAQAASLEQTTASVRELTEAVDRSAQSAGAVNEMAGGVRGIAEAGGVAIQSSVASMKDIQTSSRRVEEIVGVIEGIAFQTNLLALNAAVEAARAGEQGRGFAVVAAEVRTLAQRSSASARQIKTLIGESVGFVEAGARQIDAASQTFADIVAGVREVAQNVRSISSAASAQSEGLAQISQAVGHIDALTQQNAQMVEQALHSSSQLSDRAERLQGAVASFKLRQGSADEALAMVQRAVALYQRMGSGALREITNDKAQWADRDMYVFAFDRQGRYQAFGGNPAKVGSSVRDVPGVNGDKLVRDAFERAAFGGGWVDYDFANPQTGGTDLKTSYVEPVSADLVLGCGVYKSRSAATGATGTAFRRGPREEHRQALADKGAAPAGPLVLNAQTV